jgi:hypothetical protein
MQHAKKSDVKKQDFIIVKEKNNIDIAKIVAPHALQIGIDGFKGSSLKVYGSGFICGSLEIIGGVKGALKLPDGTTSIRSGAGIKVSDARDGSVTLSVGTSTGGVETLVRSGDGLMSSVVNGILTLSLNRETTLPYFSAGAGMRISRVSNHYTLALDTDYIAASEAGVIVNAGSGLVGTEIGGKLSLSINESIVMRQSSLIPGSGISFSTGSDGKITISSVTSSMSQQTVQATDGITGSLFNNILTISLDRTGIAALSGSTFTGPVIAGSGLSGSLTTLADGSSPYLIAGQGIQISTGSSGQVQISSLSSASASAGTEIVMNAQPVGQMNGENLVFSLDHEPADKNAFMLWLNGQLMSYGFDYSINGQEITFINSIPPESADKIRVMYSKQSITKLYAMNVVPQQITAAGNQINVISLPNEPAPQDSLMLFLNGQLLTQGNSNDYSIVGKNVYPLKSFLVEDIIRATYSYVA